MKAVRVHEYGGPEVLKVDEIERKPPAAGEMEIAVLACGLNPIDAWGRSGHLVKRLVRELPYTPGIDVVGTVAELGEGVTGFAVGDLVMGILSPVADGGYAEYVIAEAGRFVAVPEGLDPVAAAAGMTPVVTGLQLADKALAERDCHHILVLGALGAVGRAALVRAVSRGVEVTAMVRAGQEAEALALGARHAVASNGDAGSAAGDQRFECILDTIGPDQVARWEDSVADGGLVLSIVPLPPAPFTRTDVELTGFGYSPDPAIVREAALLVREGKLGERSVERVALEDTGKAHEVLLNAAGGRKFVVVPGAADQARPA